MPPKVTPNVTTRTGSSTHASSASQTQADAQMDPLLETDNDDVQDNADVAQLREQIRTLNQARKDD